MADLRNQRRIAASILKCGKNRVWMDQDRVDEIAKAVTRNDIRILIKGKAIKSKQFHGISTGRKRFAYNQRVKGRRRGQGSRKGSKYARLPRKARWMQTIRSLRTYLKKLRNENKIDRRGYRSYYRRVKGGEFRSTRHLHTHLATTGIVREEKK